MRVIDYTPLFELARVSKRKRDEAEKSTFSFKRKLDALLYQNTRDTIPGDEYIRKINHWLEFLDPDPTKPYRRRSPAQKAFHVAMIDACLPHIYGGDFPKYRERILQERKMEEIASEVLICCPRRFGKTTSVSMFVAVLLYCVPDMWISCFSTGQRASSTLLDQAATFFNRLPGAKEKVLKKNQEQYDAYC